MGAWGLSAFGGLAHRVKINKIKWQLSFLVDSSFGLQEPFGKLVVIKSSLNLLLIFMQDSSIK